MAHQPDASPPSNSFDSALWLGVIICLAAAAGLIWFFHQSSPKIEAVTDASFEFEPIDVDEARLDSERERQAPEPIEDSKNVRELRDAFRTLNALQFGEPNMEKARSQASRMGFAANEVLTEVPLESFVAVGEPVFALCREGLQDLLKSLRAGEITLEEAKTDPPEEDYATYRRNCGNALTFLLDAGLLNEKGKWVERDVGLTIFDIINRYRWAHIMHLRKPAHEQLTPYELELLMRWRIERSDAYTAQEHEKFLERARTVIPDYANVAAGKLAYQKGNIDEALEHFQKACDANPKDRQLARYCEYLKKKAAKPGSKSGEEGGH